MLGINEDASMKREIEEMAENITQRNKKLKMSKQLARLPVMVPKEIQPFCGNFGWDKIDDMDCPYILRGNEKFCATRIMGFIVLKKFPNFTKDVYDCVLLRQFQITKNEVVLLNEINFNHCDGLFGRIWFTENERLLLLKDVVELNEFLTFCRERFYSPHKYDNHRCGFLKLNQNPLVPFVQHNSERYVPLFYFDGDFKELNKYKVQLTGWHFTYIKFCCKIQGIRSELYAGWVCDAVPVTKLVKFLPPNSQFEICWITRINNKMFVKSITTTSTHKAHGDINIPDLNTLMYGTVNDSPRTETITNQPSDESTARQVSASPYLPDFDVLLGEASSTIQQTVRKTDGDLSLDAEKFVKDYQNMQISMVATQQSSSVPIKNGYKLFRVPIGNLSLFCINLHVNNFTYLGIGVREFCNKLFKDVSYDMCCKAMRILKIRTYSAKPDQKPLLRGCPFYVIDEKPLLVPASLVLSNLSKFQATFQKLINGAVPLTKPVNK